MADIDDELLALAGGDSEDEGSASNRGPSLSPPLAKREGKKEQAKKPKRKDRGDESEEEGEA